MCFLEVKISDIVYNLSEAVALAYKLLYGKMKKRHIPPFVCAVELNPTLTYKVLLIKKCGLYFNKPRVPIRVPMFALAMVIVGYALVVGNRKVANRNSIRFYARSSLLANETFPTILLYHKIIFTVK